MGIQYLFVDCFPSHIFKFALLGEKTTFYMVYCHIPCLYCQRSEGSGSAIGRLTEGTRERWHGSYLGMGRGDGERWDMSAVARIMLMAGFGISTNFRGNERHKHYFRLRLIKQKQEDSNMIYCLFGYV